jgi:HSP20 family molecular chaperone IbpA
MVGTSLPNTTITPYKIGDFPDQWVNPNPTPTAIPSIWIEPSPYEYWPYWWKKYGDDIVINQNITINNKLEKDLVSSQVPPSNIYLKRDGAMEIEVAVTGLDKINLDIKMEGDYLIITPLAATIKDVSYLQQGLKQFTDPLKFYIDRSKFDITKIEAIIDKGLLTITIKPVESTKIEIKQPDKNVSITG